MQSVVERDYSNYKEVSGANNDEGLAIANLRIAPQIIDALAKKGIAELFPIQNIQDNQEGSYEEKYNKHEDSSRQILILKQQNIVETQNRSIQVDMANIQKKKEEAKALKELKAKAQQKGSFEVLGSRKVERNKGSLS
ncbi:hypothetical protein JHK87_039713 [Glycine soja]|nr:hypothetical protein JHK87_039713 [Glycine soja]